MTDLAWLRPTKPTQLTEADLKTMTPEQIIEAEQRGHLQDLLNPTPEPSVWKSDDEKLQAAAKGANHFAMEQLRRRTERDTQAKEAKKKAEREARDQAEIAQELADARAERRRLNK